MNYNDEEEETLRREAEGRRGIAWRRYDWSAPFASTLYTLYVFAMDGVLFVCVIAFAHGVEYILDMIESGSVPIIAGYAVHASTIVRFGDYSLFAGFVIIQGGKLLGRTWRNDD